MGRVEGKVAFVTGAARGQGRSHAVQLAEEGADIIAIDLCEDIATIGYPLATPEDLDETARLVEKAGRQVVTAQADVRDVSQLGNALRGGIAEFGKLDVVVTAAGVAGMKGDPPLQAWCDVINTNLVGTINAIQVALPHLREGASIIATGSNAALMNVPTKDNPGDDPGGMAYMTSKRLLSQYVWDLATQLAVRGIRANVVHPTNTNTPMLQSEPMYRSFRPDLPHPTRQDAEPVFAVQQAMRIPYVEPPRRQQRSALAGLRRSPLRHGSAAARRRRRLSQVVRLPHLKGATVKVWVDGQRCQGHTLCSMIAPDSFQLDDIDGHSSAVCEVVPPDQEELVREAAHSCPEQAIVVEEETAP